MDGWLHTGDIGRLDEDGYLVLVDRIKDMIIRGGENIYPKEIETVVYQLPADRRGRRGRRAHPVYGEVPVRYVVAELRRRHHRRDASMSTSPTPAVEVQAPVAITILDDLPKNPVGKIDKPKLRRLIAENR